MDNATPDSGHHHHHGDCNCAHAQSQSDRAADALQRAETLCRKRGVRLTRIRRQVLEALYATHRPLGAYDIADALSRVEDQRDKRHLAPITIYRALNFLLEQGLVHRLISRNAFIACPHGHNPGDLVVFLICEDCGGVDELSSEPLAQAVLDMMTEQQFEPVMQVMEITGRCSHCRKSVA